MWTRVSPVSGHVLDLLHARMTWPYAPHVHEDFSIGVCTEGTEVISYRGTLRYARPGSVVILAPGEPHTGGPAGSASFVYQAMYPPADLLANDTGRVPWFADPVVTDPELATGLVRAHDQLARGTDPLDAESRLAWLLGELVRRHACPPLTGSGNRAAGAGIRAAGTDMRTAGGTARLVQDMLASQLHQPPSLAEIAVEAGQSRYQVLRSFRSEVGMPPYAWLAQYRVARARVLLERGCGLAETAASTGFADQAHLTRWFRRVVGVTPGVYRNSVQDSAPPYR